jgi:hypothetical protein
MPGESGTSSSFSKSQLEVRLDFPAPPRLFLPSAKNNNNKTKKRTGLSKNDAQVREMPGVCGAGTTALALYL